MNPPIGYISAGQAAALLGVHPATIGLWVRQGRLQVAHRTNGGHARFDPDVVLAAKILRDVS